MVITTIAQAYAENFSSYQGIVFELVVPKAKWFW